MCDYARKLDELIRRATFNVSDNYFQLRAASENGPILKYRERVYCYELYHQMRMISCDIFSSSPFKLHGEIDKSGGGYITSNEKPDFLLHIPGEMHDRSNLAIIEVKPLKEDINLEKDLKTLSKFFYCYQYKYPIYLFFGGENGCFERTKEKMITLDRDSSEIDLSKIIIYHHANVSEQAINIGHPGMAFPPYS